jgi:hypothetical protein
MSWTQPSPQTRGLVRRWELISLALLVVGVTFLVVGLRGHTADTKGRSVASQGEQQAGSGTSDPDSGEAAGGSGDPQGDGAGSPRSTGTDTEQPIPRGLDPDPAVVPSSLPVQIRIPAIGVRADVTRLGLNADSTVEVPSDPDDTGWYKLGPSPGQVGSSVILGHVDSTSGPAVFISLRYLSYGDRVVVRLADGVRAHFRVTKVATYPNAEFPAQKVYGPNGSASELHLVTCGGSYDSSAGGYQSNVVVYTSLIRTSAVDSDA